MVDIFKKLKTDFEFATGFVYKGLVQALGAGFASRIKEFNDKLEFIKKQAFIKTADKDYLYLIASDILPPKPAEIAQGLVVVYGTNGSIVPANTEIKDDEATFKIIADATIAQVSLAGNITVVDGVATLSVSNQITNTTALVNGVSKAITVIDGNTLQFDAGTFTDGLAVTVVVYCAIATAIADVAGTAGNRDLNDVLKTKTTISGINSEVGVLSIAGGIDDENVEDYRQRVIDFFANPQSPFSKTNIIAVNKERISTLKYVWVKGGEVVDGTVEVIAINKSYGLTAQEVTELQNNTLAIAPAQVDGATAISVRSADVVEYDITISNLLPASVGLRDAIEKNLKYYFDKDTFEKDITQASIEAVIYQTKNGAESVASFTLVGGWSTATEYTIRKLRNVVYQ